MSQQQAGEAMTQHAHQAPPDWGAVPMRNWLYRWLLDPDTAGNHQAAIDRFIGLLIVANLVALLFEHVPAVFEPHAWPESELERASKSVTNARP
ncbi:MAG: hypothetical protein EBX60_03010, partial [Betaproteobacteria bacterium]|nr:hypothetical protein [Betaproteobacteria bacterium]